MNKQMKEILINSLNARLTVIARNRKSASAMYAEVYDLDEKLTKDALDWVKNQKVS